MLPLRYTTPNAIPIFFFFFLFLFTVFIHSFVSLPFFLSISFLWLLKKLFSFFYPFLSSDHIFFRARWNRCDSIEGASFDWNGFQTLHPFNLFFSSTKKNIERLKRSLREQQQQQRRQQQRQHQHQQQQQRQQQQQLTSGGQKSCPNVTFFCSKKNFKCIHEVLRM